MPRHSSSTRRSSSASRSSRRSSRHSRSGFKGLKRRLKRRKIDWTSLLIGLLAVSVGLLMFQRSIGGSSESAPSDGAAGEVQ